MRLFERAQNLLGTGRSKPPAHYLITIGKQGAGKSVFQQWAYEYLFARSEFSITADPNFNESSRLLTDLNSRLVSGVLPPGTPGVQELRLRIAKLTAPLAWQLGLFEIQGEMFKDFALDNDSTKRKAEHFAKMFPQIYEAISDKNAKLFLAFVSDGALPEEGRTADRITDDALFFTILTALSDPTVFPGLMKRTAAAFVISKPEAAKIYMQGQVYAAQLADKSPLDVFTENIIGGSYKTAQQLLGRDRVYRAPFSLGGPVQPYPPGDPDPDEYHVPARSLEDTAFFVHRMLRFFKMRLN